MFSFWWIFCIIKITAMTTNRNKHMITNKIIWIRQLFFLHMFHFIIKWVLIHISSFHSNTNLTISHSNMSHFLYLNIHQYSIQFYIQYHTFQEPRSSSSLHLHQHLIWFHFCIELHTLSFNPHLHSHESCWTKSLVWITLDTNVNTLTFIFFTLIETHTDMHYQQCHNSRHIY